MSSGVTGAQTSFMLYHTYCLNEMCLKSATVCLCGVKDELTSANQMVGFIYSISKYDSDELIVSLWILPKLSDANYNYKL